jgi:hypothetical protein
MDESLEKALLDMEARDQALRAELTASGELDERYHPRLEELHRSLVGDKGAQAAWRIALHSISEPEFMRQCRDLLDTASQNRDVPRWQFAMIDDRVRVYEGRPQRYGTQLRGGPDGPRPYPLENESRINSMRMQAGLPPLAQALAKARAAQPKVSAEEQARRDAAELELRRSAGWIS